MYNQYIAHIDENGNKQSLREHSEGTSRLCRQFAVEELKDFLAMVGTLHDIGKIQPSFQKRIGGEDIRVEHSTCGALAAKECYPIPSAMSLMMEYCIAGHHGGIPDGGFSNDDTPTLQGRMNRVFEDFSSYKDYLEIKSLDGIKWLHYLCDDCNNNIDKLIDKYAFLTRYVFSCLVDADSIDTATFCGSYYQPSRFRADFKGCLKAVDERFASFHPVTELQKARSELQSQAFNNIENDSEIYLLNMPTGAGKTLAAIKMALERIQLSQNTDHVKRRIIYIAPYNSIIDQTYREYQKIFDGSANILRHQSTYSYEDREDLSEDYRNEAKSAIENWDSDMIITTFVQFFETIYSNKRGKLRKMHNMADSILIIDEAHLMPVELLQPCLQSIAYITKYLNSEAIFLTATMPDFYSLIKKYALSESRLEELINDKNLFSKFQKCKYKYLNAVDDEELLCKAKEYPSSLIIVNTKSKARRLYQKCQVKKYHLSTYMCSYDRERVLNEIKEDLLKLEKDYQGLENVPESRRICIISTSLIEAGVDLDVFSVFRELAGLDSILQSGGRCNREGRRKQGEVFIFTDGKKLNGVKESITKGLLERYDDISKPECIKEYYDNIYFNEQKLITQKSMHNYCHSIEHIPFRTYAEDFKYISDRTMSIVVGIDEKSRKLIDELHYSKNGSVREMQNYTCTVYRNELEDLLKQRAVDDFGTGIYCLVNPDYYDRQIGITFEAKDYFIE